LRPRAEQLAAGYLSVVEKAASTGVAALKLLEVLDIIRARDVAIQAVRTMAIGEQIRRDWPRATIRLYRIVNQRDRAAWFFVSPRLRLLTVGIYIDLVHRE